MQNRDDTNTEVGLMLDCCLSKLPSVLAVVGVLPQPLTQHSLRAQHMDSKLTNILPLPSNKKILLCILITYRMSICVNLFLTTKWQHNFQSHQRSSPDSFGDAENETEYDWLPYWEMQVHSSTAAPPHLLSGLCKAVLVACKNSGSTLLHVSITSS